MDTVNTVFWHNLPPFINMNLIISLLGNMDGNNLALACLRCNRQKGPNIGSIDPKTGELVAFYNPRKQNWEDHFSLNQAEIQPLTAVGRVTVNILKFNHPDRIKEREILISLGIYP